ncbi:cytochrome-c peroxidase [Paraburkholderia panacisoli]|nr:cytochrome c peroxidase [Paraburkholderia panacisoli]
MRAFRRNRGGPPRPNPIGRLTHLAAQLTVAVAAAWLACLAHPQDIQGGGSLTGQDQWTPDEKAQLEAMRLTPDAKAKTDPSNRVAATPAAAQLGRLLFNDARFSRNGAISCASCHHPGQQFQDGLPRAMGLSEGMRRTMPVVDVTEGPWFFWDGRKDSLWAQAVGPLEDQKEHGGNRLHDAHVLQEHYRSSYEALFGPMPDLRGLPQNASPLGTGAEKAAWQALPGRTRAHVSLVFANMGKALAAYETTLRVRSSRFDQYIDGVKSGDPKLLMALSPAEKAGLHLFLDKGRCATCHNGPLLTDHQFHNIGVPPADPNHPDQGRAAAIQKVLADEFNCLGPFSDAKPEQCEELRFIAKDDPHMLGAFKTPSLRNVALRAPYMHAGQMATLEDVMRHYAKPPHAIIGESELKTLNLSETEQQELLSLLRALSGPVIENGQAQ